MQAIGVSAAAWDNQGTCAGDRSPIRLPPRTHPRPAFLRSSDLPTHAATVYSRELDTLTVGALYPLPSRRSRLSPL